MRSTYVKKEADALLSNGRYHNIEGKLYADLSTDASRGYYVDWNKYGYEVNDITEKTAELRISTMDNSPAGVKNVVSPISVA